MKNVLKQAKGFLDVQRERTKREEEEVRRMRGDEGGELGWNEKEF